MSNHEEHPQGRYSLASTVTARESQDVTTRSNFDDTTLISVPSAPVQPTKSLPDQAHEASNLLGKPYCPSEPLVQNTMTTEPAVPRPAHHKSSGATDSTPRDYSRSNFSTPQRLHSTTKIAMYPKVDPRPEPREYKMPLKSLEGGLSHQWIHRQLNKSPLTRSDLRRRIVFAIIVFVLFVVVFGVAWSFADDGKTKRG